MCVYCASHVNLLHVEDRLSADLSVVVSSVSAWHASIVDLRRHCSSPQQHPIVVGGEQMGDSTGAGPGVPADEEFVVTVTDSRRATAYLVAPEADEYIAINEWL